MNETASNKTNANRWLKEPRAATIGGHESGFSLVELLISTLLLIIGMLFFSALFGSSMAAFLKTEHIRVGKTYAETGLGDLTARVRRNPSNQPQTEAADWATPHSGYITLSNGSVKRTAATGEPTVIGTTQQKIVAGPAYIEFTPDYGSGITFIDSNGSTRSIAVGWGGWAGIAENDSWPAQTCCSGSTIPVFTPGSRYRIELSDRTRYYIVNGAAKTLIFESSNPALRFPVTAQFSIYRDQDHTISNVYISGVMSDPNYIPDGGNLTPGSPCVYPYCDLIFQPARSGATLPPPVAVSPTQTAPAGAQLLFIRRFNVRTVDTTTNVREITMALASSISDQPFLTRTTRVLANR